MIAHHFKHTHSNLDEPNPHHDGILLSFALGLGEKPDQLETRNLVFLVRDVLKFFAAAGDDFAISGRPPPGTIS